VKPEQEGRTLQWKKEGRRKKKKWEWTTSPSSVESQAETRRNEDAALLSSYLLLFILLHSWTFLLGLSFHSKQRLSMHSLSYLFFFLSFSLLNWTDFCRSVCSWTGTGAFATEWKTPYTVLPEVGKAIPFLSLVSLLRSFTSPVGKAASTLNLYDQKFLF